MGWPESNPVGLRSPRRAIAAAHRWGSAGSHSSSGGRGGNGERSPIADNTYPPTVCDSLPLGYRDGWTRQRSLASAAEGNRGMLVGGVPIDDRLLRELARIVPPTLARRVDTALLYRAKVLGITVAEREIILAALEDAPADLAELRGVLLRELEWRRPEGL